MRALLLLIISLMMPGCTRSADFGTPGAMSKRLQLTASCEPNESQFRLVLRNVSLSTVRVAVESQQFHGRIILTAPTGSPAEFFDSRFLPRLLTSVWEVPTHTLPPQATITWALPVSILSDIHGATLDPRTLPGATVHAQIEEVAIVPSSASYASNNAKQVSKPVIFPREL